MAAVVEVTNNDVSNRLRRQFPAAQFIEQFTLDDFPTLWVERACLIEILDFLQNDFEMLFDLCGVDERMRQHRAG